MQSKISISEFIKIFLGYQRPIFPVKFTTEEIVQLDGIRREIYCPINYSLKCVARDTGMKKANINFYFQQSRRFP